MTIVQFPGGTMFYLRLSEPGMSEPGRESRNLSLALLGGLSHHFFLIMGNN